MINKDIRIHEKPAVFIVDFKGGAFEAYFNNFSQLSTYNFLP